MVTWQEIEDELLRMRQSLSCPRDLRKLGPGDFELRPLLFDAVHRYTRGRCLDFAVGLAVLNPALRFSGLYAGNDLIHAFVMDDSGSCMEVSGIWSLSEMKKLHASDGRFALRQPPLDQILEAIQVDEASGADFDTSETVLSVAGCLPHLRAFVPDEYVVRDPDEALLKLKALAENGFIPIPARARLL